MAFENYTAQDWQNWYDQARALGWNEQQMSDFVASQTGQTYSPESIAQNYGGGMLGTPTQNSYQFDAGRLNELGISPTRGFMNLNDEWQTPLSTIPRQNADGSWSVYNVIETSPGQFQAVDSGVRGNSQDDALQQVQALASKDSGFIDSLLSNVVTPAIQAGTLYAGGQALGGLFGGGAEAGALNSFDSGAMANAMGYGGGAAGGALGGGAANVAAQNAFQAAGGTAGGQAALTAAETAFQAAGGIGASSIANMFSGAAGSGLLGVGANLIGGVLQNQTNKDIANQNADLIRQQNENTKFRPVGVTTRFGQSQFGYDQNGRLTSAGYTLNPDVKMLQDRQIGMVGGLQGDWEKAVELGRGAMKTPEQYMQEQLGLLAPTREQGLAAIRNQAQQTGRAGLATGGTSTTMATNPELAAYYNAVQQENARLAANAPQQSLALANQGLGLMSAGYQPLATAVGSITGLENLGQGAMDIGTNLGAQVSTAGARMQTPQMPNQVNPWAAGLMGGLNAYNTYQQREPLSRPPVSAQNPYVPVGTYGTGNDANQYNYGFDPNATNLFSW